MDPVERETVFGRSIKMHGELSGAENICIDGDFEGVIRLGGARVTIGPEARVRATIAAQEVIVHGKFDGEIRATGAVALRSRAVVVGDIFAARFSMEEETALRGTVDPTRAMDPLAPSAAGWSAGASRPAEPAAMETPAPMPLFGRGAGPDEARYPHIPAGLAAAARHFNEAVSPSAAEPSSEGPSEDPTEFAETQA